MVFLWALVLLPCLAALAAVLVGCRLRNMQPRRILPTSPPRAGREPGSCDLYVESGRRACQCLWRYDGERSGCSLRELQRCRLELPESAGLPLLPSPNWGRETLLVAHYSKTQ